MDTILDVISGKTENSASEIDDGSFEENLSNLVEELMHEFFILVRTRFESESTNNDVNLLIRALDRIHCRVQTFNRSLLTSITSVDFEGVLLDDLSPESLSIVNRFSLLTNQFSNSALEIINQVARMQTTYYFDILCQNAVESFTDLRHKLASHGLQTSNSTNEEVNKVNKIGNNNHQLSSLLDALSSSLVSQLRNVLKAEEAFLSTDSTFSSRPQFRNSFCIDQIREGLIVGYLNFLVQFLSDLAKTAVCKIPGPILLTLGKLCLMWADSGTVGHLISLADDFMLFGNDYVILVMMIAISKIKRFQETKLHWPPYALVRPRVRRVRSPSRNALTWSRVYSLCQGSPTHCLLVAGVLFTRLSGRKVNVRRFNRVGGHGGSA
ncbi:unnamed protein product [Schistosoma curassoni]|uniref:Vacuolar protein sorting-associated protein 51 homolog n=1 Tax=Schistosoma curassoni TaxID=6186 RepID=A0A183KW50_9TREM|nr:unnamed protein product [Schistosoma curassoni]